MTFYWQFTNLHLPRFPGYALRSDYTVFIHMGLSPTLLFCVFLANSLDIPACPHPGSLSAHLSSLLPWGHARATHIWGPAVLDVLQDRNPSLYVRELEILPVRTFGSRYCSRKEENEYSVILETYRTSVGRGGSWVMRKSRTRPKVVSSTFHKAAAIIFQLSFFFFINERFPKYIYSLI